MSDKSLELRMAQRMGLSTAREYRQLKRAQMDAVMRALDEFSVGCASCPGYATNLKNLFDSAAVVRESLRVKNWGR